MSDIDSESEWESSYIISDGPIQLALDPSQKFREGNKPEKNQRKPLNPQRVWEPEGPINVNLNPKQIYNVPNHNQDYFHSHSSGPAIQNYDHHYRGMPKNPERKTTSTRSFQVSTIGKNGEKVFEEQTVNENGEQVLHKTSYKRKINQQRLDELEEEEDLISMNKKISTRFLLTKCHPTMTIGSVEKHIRKHFDIGDIYIRRNPDRHDNYSSFILIISSEEELDIKKFEHHNWPGLIRCFFSPRDRHSGH